MRFLIIDDSPADRELVTRSLLKEFPGSEFVQVGHLDDLDKALAYDGFDIVLTDYQLNWANGLQILNRVKEFYPDVPVVMVTGTGSEEIAVEGLRSGLSNYILKSHLDRIPTAVRESLNKARLQKQYEEAIAQLRFSEERYREIFEQGLTAIFVASPQGNIVTCNPAFARIFGFASVQDGLQADLAALYPQPELYRQFIEHLKREKRIDYQDTEMLRCDGQTIHTIGNILGNFDEEGNLSEIKGYLFDHTEHKKLEDQLQQAQRLESVGLLVSGIAHDFNNMLGGILGYTSRGMSRITDSHPLYDNLQHIQEIANRAARMTRQLLAFSRRQVLEPSDVNLNSVVESLLSFLGKILEDHIEIEFIPEVELKTVHVDYAQMEQVLMNLCVNAHDAMPEGGKLTIRTTNVLQDEAHQVSDGQLRAPSYVRLLVQDNGVGMAPQLKEQIFEPFFTTKDVGKGTGLGLSMVHGIIAQHDGYIQVDSQQGVGTTFSIYLPTVENTPIPVPTPLPFDTQQGLNAQGGDEMILVVEDDPDLRCLMEEALSEYGYHVMSAADGAEGLDLFKEHQQEISLVVSDLMTPKMKGKELYDTINTMQTETRFLFISGYQANQISQNFVLDKGFTFLPKPFDLDELAAKVREVLN